MLRQIRSEVIKNGTEIWHVDCFTSRLETNLKSISHRLDNAKKRDSKLLQVIRMNNADLVGKCGAIYQSVSDARKEIETVGKTCRSIYNVAGMCGNNDTEAKAKLCSLDKNLKKAVKVLDIFEAMTESVKKGSYQVATRKLNA